MPAKRKKRPLVKLSIAVDPPLKARFDSERLKRNLSGHEMLYFLMDKAGMHVSVRGGR